MNDLWRYIAFLAAALAVLFYLAHQVRRIALVREQRLELEHQARVERETREKVAYARAVRQAEMERDIRAEIEKAYNVQSRRERKANHL